MMTFTESGLVFSFRKTWIVKQYDDHTYFQGLSGAGLKGMDFIGYQQQQPGIFLFEVKNYRNRINPHTGNTIYAPIQSPERMAATLIRKVEDTLTAIDAVQQYYQRSWWYRRLLPLIRRWPVLQANRVFWTRMYEAVHQQEAITVVFWLELPTPALAYRAKLLASAEDQLAQKNIRLILAQVEQAPFADSLSVHIIPTDPNA